MTDFQSFLSGLEWSRLTDLLIRIIPALICITFHELSHGFVAYKLGDNTAKNAGRLTLNPIRHIDIMGLVMMVLFRFGWAKPVPVDMRNFKNPKRGMAITALAGPVSNVVLAIVTLFIYGLAYIPLASVGGAAAGFALDILHMIPQLSLYLALFNILPIPPLDGSKVLFAILPETAYRKLMFYERYGMILLFIIAWTGVLGKTLGTAAFYVFEKLFNLAAGAGFWLFSRFV